MDVLAAPPGKRDRSSPDHAHGPDLKKRKFEPVENVSVNELQQLLRHVRKVIAKAPDFAMSLLTQNGEMCIALLHAQAVVGILPERMNFLPLSNEEIELAKTKSKEIQDKLAKYRFWTTSNVGPRPNANRMPSPGMGPSGVGGGLNFPMPQMPGLNKGGYGPVSSSRGYGGYGSSKGAGGGYGSMASYYSGSNGGGGGYGGSYGGGGGGYGGGGGSLGGYGSSASSSAYGGGSMYGGGSSSGGYGGSGGGLSLGAGGRPAYSAAPAAAAGASITQEQRAKLLERISRLTPEQFNMLPPDIQNQARLYLGARVSG
ncbi:unnamed protein product [Amoebophrya sp. A25]|nr:unnamed protein product [Amoebophrya sp. A25]|eukprot:GSA25T00006819001.1